MEIEIISVGSEILLGDIVNTNAQYIASRLAQLGLDSHYQTVVGDNADRLKGVLDVAFSRADAVIITGGLGPTKDDMTKEMLMEFFHQQTRLDEKALAMMATRLKKSSVEELSGSLRKQAIVPAGAMIMYNHHGQAPGCIMESDEGKVCILLPGPPREMKPMFEECCDTYLRDKSNKMMVSLNIKLLSMQEAPPAMVGESPVAERLGALLDGSNPTVATYAKEDGVLIRITASAATYEEAMSLAEDMAGKCREVVGAEYVQYIEKNSTDHAAGRKTSLGETSKPTGR